MGSLKNAASGRCWRAPVVFLCMLAMASALSAQDVTAKVQQILNTPQRYNGSMIYDLAQLGSPAVPALTENLYTYRFPLVILRALQRINDPSSATPLLTFINRISADPDRQEQVLQAIALLRQFKYTPAESSLHVLMADEQASLAVRLAAASALATCGSPPVAQDATDFVLKTASENPVGTRSMRHDVLDDALGSIGSDESRSVLIDRLGSATMFAEQGRIIHLLAEDPAPMSSSALLAFAERKDRGPRARFYAVQGLVDSGMNFPRDRALGVMRQIRNVLPQYLQAKADDLSRRLGP